jgi:hypothetical protein
MHHELVTDPRSRTLHRDRPLCAACGLPAGFLPLAMCWDALFCSECLERGHASVRDVELGGES